MKYYYENHELNYGQQIPKVSENDKFFMQMYRMLVEGRPITADNLITRQYLITNLFLADGMGHSEAISRLVEFKDHFKTTTASMLYFLDYLINHSNELIEEEKLKAEKLASLPTGCNVDDSDEIIEFCRKLTKDTYNQTEASELLGISRITVGKYMKDPKYGLTTIQKRARLYVTRESLIEYYRNSRKK